MDAAARRTLTIASLATLATFLDTTILYVAFPDITATFTSTSATELSWVLNAYTIVFAALLIPAGKLADRVGHRRVFLAGSAAFTVASMACGLAPTAGVLIVFRIVQAAGAAALIPSSLALVMHAFPRDQIPPRCRHLGRGRRGRRRTGPDPGCRHRRRPGLAVGVLPQPAGGRLHRRRRRPHAARIVRSRHPGALDRRGGAGGRIGQPAVVRSRGVAPVRLAQRTDRPGRRRRSRRAGRVRGPPAPDGGAGPRPRPVRHPQLHVGEPGHAGLRHRLLGHVLRVDPVPDRGVALVDPGGRLRGRPRPRPGGLRRPAPARSPVASASDRSSSPVASSTPSAACTERSSSVPRSTTSATTSRRCC